MITKEGKKNYQIMLDEEAMKALDRWLEAAGITRSGFLNTYVVKVVEAMELKKIPDYKKMTLPQLLKMVGSLGKLMDVNK
jgi:hypothetical protein